MRHQICLPALSFMFSKQSTKLAWSDWLFSTSFNKSCVACEQKVSLYSSSRTSPTNATDPVRLETMHTYPSHCFTDDDISVWVSDRSCSKLTPVLSLVSSVQSFSLIMERIPQSSTSAVLYVHKGLFKLLTLTMFLFPPLQKFLLTHW